MTAWVTFEHGPSMADEVRSARGRFHGRRGEQPPWAVVGRRQATGAGQGRALGALSTVHSTSLLALPRNGHGWVRAAASCPSPGR